MNKFKFTIRGNDYDVNITGINDNIATIEVNGSAYEVEIHKLEKKTKTPTLVRKPIIQEIKQVERKEEGSSTIIKAPLPGAIIQTLVKEGDSVKKNQTLLTMEAMKMENNVMAEKDGVIKKILVKSGDAVLQGDPLIEIA